MPRWRNYGSNILDVDTLRRQWTYNLCSINILIYKRILRISFKIEVVHNFQWRCAWMVRRFNGSWTMAVHYASRCHSATLCHASRNPTYNSFLNTECLKTRSNLHWQDLKCEYAYSSISQNIFQMVHKSLLWSKPVKYICVGELCSSVL